MQWVDSRLEDLFKGVGEGEASASEGKERELALLQQPQLGLAWETPSGARHSESPACRAPPRFHLLLRFTCDLDSLSLLEFVLLTLDSTAVPQRAFELAVSSELRPTLMTVSRPPPNLGPPKTAGNA